MNLKQRLSARTSLRVTVLGILGIVLVIVIAGFFLLRIHGLTVHEEARAAYLNGRCPQALPLYADLASYPDLMGKFVAQAAAERAVCVAYEDAEAKAAASDEAASIEAYESFLSAHQESPLLSQAVANIEENYLSWGQALRGEGDFSQAVSTYARLGADYPQSDQKAKDEILATYLAWGESLRQEEAFSESITILEELAAEYPAFGAPAEEQLLASFLAWGDSLRQEKAYAAAIAVYAALEDDYSSFGEQARQQILAAYLAWGETLASGGDFEGAIAAYDEMAAGHDVFQREANEQARAAFLNWADDLSADGAFDEAIQVYDLMMARNGAFFEAGISPRNETFLAWGDALLQGEQFEKAAQVLLTLLQREHDRLAPLPLDPGSWPAAAPLPVGVMPIRDPGAFLDVVRSGPGDEYEPVNRAAVSDAGNVVAIVGANADASWVAVDVGRTGTGDVELGRIETIEWQDDGSSFVVWLPASAAEPGLLMTEEIPMAGPFARSLAATSESVSSALTALTATHEAWATAAAGSGDLKGAINSLLAHADLVADGPLRETLWQRAATFSLSQALSEFDDQAYRDSLQDAVLAESYDVSGGSRVAARTLRTSNLLALADQSASAEEWETAAGYYAEVLALEQDTFAHGWAIVNRNGVYLLDAADRNGGRVQPAAMDSTFPALASQQSEAGDWTLLLVTTAETGLGWVPTEQISLTIPFTDLPSYESAALPPLGSLAAITGLSRSHQAWGQALHAANSYEEAIAHFQLILDDFAMQSVITGTAELAAESWLAWGDSLLSSNREAEAVEKLAAAINVASRTAAATEATALLTEIVTELEQVEEETLSCDEIPILEAMAGTGVERRANALRPRATYQCAQAYHAAASYELARQYYQRVVDEFGNSAFAARARRGLLTLDWIALVQDDGIASAARQVCEETGTTVRAGLLTLNTPHVVIASGSGLETSDLPDEWRGPVMQTTVIVCTVDMEDYRIERCPYVLTGSTVANAYIDRYRSYRDIWIVDPIARLTVAQSRVYGGYPDSCTSTSLFSGPGDVKSWYGDRPDEEALLDWLDGRIEE